MQSRRVGVDLQTGPKRDGKIIKPLSELKGHLFKNANARIHEAFRTDADEGQFIVSFFSC